MTTISKTSKRLQSNRSYRASSTGRVAAWTLAAFCGVVLGCEGGKTTPPTAAPEQPPAVVETSGPVVPATTLTAQGTAAQAEELPDVSSSSARRLLEQVIQRYKNARQYSDSAVVELSYRRGGQPFVDRADLLVSFERDRVLALQAYGLELRIADRELRARVNDPTSDNLAGQVVVQRLEQARFGLADIYRDPLLTHFATAGLGGPSPQLELLLAEKPFEGLVSGNAQLRLGSTADIEQHRCQSLLVSQAGQEYRFWFDTEQLLLRRVELPAASAGLEADPEITEVRLLIDFKSAQWSVPSAADWSLPSGENDTTVAHFVLPPPPLVSPLLGRQPNAFRLTASNEQFEITERGGDRPQTVLLWIADHPASQFAARALQKVADQQSDGKVRFVVVMAEPNAAGRTTTSVEMLRRWGVGLPVIDDVSAVGRDVFAISEAPTIVVLGQDGTVEWFQPRAGVEIETGIPMLLTDLASGKRVGAEIRGQYETDLATYRRLIEEAHSQLLIPKPAN